MNIKFATRLLDVLFAVSLLIIIFWLAVYDINPSGIRVIEHSASHNNSLVSGPGPRDRVLGIWQENGVKYWEIGVDPVYFDLYIPRVYQKVKMSVEFRSQSQDFIELGGLGASTGWQITLKPGYNKILSDLSWPCENIGEIKVCTNLKKNNKMPKNLDEFRDMTDKRLISYHFKFPDDKEIVMDSWGIDKDLSAYDYLLTAYKNPVELSDGWQKMSATFGAEELWLKGHIYKFIISAPEMDKHGGRLQIKKVTFALYKEPIGFDNIKIKLSRFLRRNLKKVGF